MDWKRYSIMVTALVLAAAMLAEAQRPGLFTTLTATGAIAGGAAITGLTETLTHTAPFFRSVESDAGVNEKTFDITSTAGVLAFNITADNLATGTSFLTLTRSGITPSVLTFAPQVFSTAGQIRFTTTQNIGTTTGNNAITTLNADTYMLRVTTGGDAADDTITNINGGAAGRTLVVCWIAETMAGDGALDIVDSGLGTAADRILGTPGGSITMTLGSCQSLIYDGTTSRWRVQAF